MWYSLRDLSFFLCEKGFWEWDNWPPGTKRSENRYFSFVHNPNKVSKSKFSTRRETVVAGGRYWIRNRTTPSLSSVLSSSLCPLSSLLYFPDQRCLGNWSSAVTVPAALQIFFGERSRSSQPLRMTTNFWLGMLVRGLQDRKKGDGSWRREGLLFKSGEGNLPDYGAGGQMTLLRMRGNAAWHSLLSFGDSIVKTSVFYYGGFWPSVLAKDRWISMPTSVIRSLKGTKVVGETCVRCSPPQRRTNCVFSSSRDQLGSCFRRSNLFGQFWKVSRELGGKKSIRCLRSSKTSTSLTFDKRFGKLSDLRGVSMQLEA